MDPFRARLNKVRVGLFRVVCTVMIFHCDENEFFSTELYDLEHLSMRFMRRDSSEVFKSIYLCDLCDTIRHPKSAFLPLSLHLPIRLRIPPTLEIPVTENSNLLRGATDIVSHQISPDFQQPRLGYG